MRRYESEVGCAETIAAKPTARSAAESETLVSDVGCAETIAAKTTARSAAERETPVTAEGLKESSAADPADGNAARSRMRLPSGSLLGRYRIAEVLGSGGMGVVYRAHDPELDRWVAIKVLREERRELPDVARFLREAQAMARLSHVNVVPIYDVGSTPAGLFLAMELIEGQTLNSWLQTEERAWREIVELMIAAGRGLAEAHGSGIVHRDFKPENVLVDRRGRPRVTDFGLARSGGFTQVLASRSLTTIPVGASALTRSGTIMGTPSYMAPEQIIAGDVGVHADIFSFCVVLFEALYGELPFAGSNLEQRHDAIVRGELVGTTRRRIPRWLGRVIRRGLAASPADRWSSMSSLLAALESGLARRRSVWALGLGLSAVALVAVLGLVADSDDACMIEGALGETWSSERSAAIGASFAASELAYAEDSWRRSAAELDEYAEVWLRAKEEACLAHRRGEISNELLDRRALCLDRLRVDLGLLVDALSVADPATIRHSVDLVDGLEKIDGCKDPEASAEEPEERRVWREGIRVRLAKLRILERTGKYGEAEQQLPALFQEIAAVGDEALRLEVLSMRADLRLVGGQYKEAEQDLQEVFSEAFARGLDRLATDAAARLIDASGEALHRFEAGDAWAKIALAGVIRIDDDGREEAKARRFYGAMLSTADRLEPALVELERACDLFTRILGEEHRLTAQARMSLGNVLWKAGRFEESIAIHEANVRSREKLLGAEHPDLISPLGNLGVALIEVGRVEEAVEIWRRALALAVSVFGEQHPSAITLALNLGVYEANLGLIEEARGHIEGAVKAARKSSGQYANMAMALSNLGDFRLLTGDVEGAEEAFVEALALVQETTGSEHSDAGRIMGKVAELRRQQGRLDEAAQLARNALEVVEASLGPDHRQIAEMLDLRASISRDRRQLRAAADDLERAMAIAESSEVSPGLRARLLFHRGRAMLELGEREAAAEQWIRRADAIAYGTEGEGELRQEISAWWATSGRTRAVSTEVRSTATDG
ncbi:MAG TPA: tetratricopeptide repeat protein [Nannocystis exedens]|nr:tetratricopeptide repeat protein [Nannocystis exedens]